MPEPTPASESTEPEPTADGAPAQTGRGALLDALRSRPGRAQVVVGTLLFAVGFAAATQVRSNEQDDQFSGLRQADLIRAFDGLAASTERAENEIERLTETKEELQSSTNARQAALDEARQLEATLSILAGTVPTTGPGIRITIEDPKGLVSAGTLLDMIQELRATGAEAMEFNDRVRIVAQTSIEETDRGIVLDGVLVEAPYVIDVVGEPVALEGSLDFVDGPIERVEKAEGTLDADQLDEVLIESVVEDASPDFAEPRDDE